MRETYFHQGHSTPVYAPAIAVTSWKANGYYDPRYKNPIFSSPNMGSWISDLVGVDIDFGKVLRNFVNAVIEGIKHVFSEIAKIVSKIDWRKIAHIFMVELNPLHIGYSLLSTNPITGHLFRELDKFTGGLFTSVESIATLGGRALRGDAISKKELISDAMFVCKVALVIVSGGTAAAIISASSDQLKGGYLGQSETGRAILGIAAAGTLAYFTGGSIINATQNAAVNIAQGEGEKQLIQKTPLGQSELGRFIAGATTRGAGAGVMGENVLSAIETHTENTGKDIAKREVGQEIGGPYGNQIANLVVERGYPPSVDSQSGSSSSTDVLGNVWEEIKKSPDNIVDAIKRFNIDVSTGLSTGKKIDLAPSHAGVPSSGFGDPSISLPELNIEANLPTSLQGWIDLYCKVNVLVGNKKVCAKRKKKVLVGGEWMWIYELDNGQYYWTFHQIDETNKYLLYAMGIAALVLVANEA